MRKSLIAPKRLGLSFFLLISYFARSQTNAWLSPASGSWENPNWSLGIIPGPGQTVLITNAGWKAVAIYPSTRQDYPLSLSISNLFLSAPSDSYSTLLLNYFGTELPLHVSHDATVRTNSRLMNLYSGLQVDGHIFITNGTYFQDHGSITATGLDFLLPCGLYLDGSSGSTFDGNMELTKMTVGSYAPATWSQTGGTNSVSHLFVGGYRINYNNGYPEPDGGAEGNYYLTNGTLLATNFYVGGIRDGFFHQAGGYVKAQSFLLGPEKIGTNLLSGDGNYYLYSGVFETRTAELGSQLGTGFFEQRGGTNRTGSLSIGAAATPLQGADGTYVISNGVLSVNSVRVGGVFASCNFFQRGGTVQIAGELSLSAEGYGNLHGWGQYNKTGGSLSAGGLTLSYYGYFNQDAGDCIISGPVTLTGDYNIVGQSSTSATINQGNFVCSNLICQDADFIQNGGNFVCYETLTLGGRGVYYDEHYNKFNGAGFRLVNGNLAASNIVVTGMWVLYGNTTNQNRITHTGSLQLGGYLFTTAKETLGPIRLISSSGLFVGPGCEMRFRDSSAQQWTNSPLTIYGWSGSLTGAGNCSVYFGTNSNGLTSNQLQQVRFLNPVGFDLGEYRAQLLPSGEIVPVPKILHLVSNEARLVITWSGGYVLQSSTNCSGPFTDMPAASNPYTNFVTNAPAAFFRLRF